MMVAGCDCDDCRSQLKATSKKAGPKAQEVYERAGKIHWYNRNLGYGFIKYSRSASVFFHHSTVKLTGFNKKYKFKKGTNVKVYFKALDKGYKAVKVEVV